MVTKLELIDPVEAFFAVELRPLYMSGDRQGRYTQLDRHYAVVDVETDSVFSVVTDQYHLIPNKDAYELAESLMVRVFKTIKHEEMGVYNVTMPRSRSFCHIDLIHKGAEFEPWEQDKWSAFLRITNSYNKTKRLKYELGFCRWICKNGLIFGTKSIEVSYAHTKKTKELVERFNENIGDIRKLEAAFTENLLQLKRFYVPEKEMLPIACKVFEKSAMDTNALTKRKIEEFIDFRDSIQRSAKHYFGELGPHGYAALNVLTEFATRPVGGLSVEGAQDGLQQKAGDWMNEFVKSISDRSFSFDSYLGDYRKSAEVLSSLQRN